MAEGQVKRAFACVALSAHLLGAVALPVLHRAHHAARGADHTHDAASHRHIHGAEGAAEGEAAAHLRFDADLAALSLSDVASAGTASVDCSLATFTLAACDDSLPPDHARGFGDLLLAHVPADTPPVDDDQGRGTLEHGSAPLLASPIFLLPPPAVPARALTPRLVEGAPRSAPRLTHAPRGPPILRA